MRQAGFFFAGAIQDNGDYERGWLLGYVNRKFSFALASKGHQRLTYLQAKIFDVHQSTVWEKALLPAPQSQRNAPQRDHLGKHIP